MLRKIETSWIELAFAIGAVTIFVIGMIVFRNPITGVIIMCGAALLAILGTAPKRLLYGLIVYSMIVKFLVGDVGFPSFANYVCDGLLLLTLALSLRRPREGYIPSYGLRLVAATLFLFWIVATVSALVNLVSPILYVWACRNTFRLFGILFCCVRLFSRDDIHRLLKYFTVFFWIKS